MATIELRLSNKVQKVTGLREVMICLRCSGKDLFSKSGIFVNPSFFEYYIDLKETTSPKVPIPKKNTATQDRAAKNGWKLRRCGEIVTSGRSLQTEDVKYHKEQSDKMDELKKAIMRAFDNSNQKSLTSDWLKDFVYSYNHPDETPGKPTFFELAEEYITCPHGTRIDPFSKKHIAVLWVLVRAMARYEGYIKATDKKRRNWSWDIDKVTRDDIEDFMDYLRNEHDLYEANPKVFAELIKNYPPSIKPGTQKILPRGSSTLIKMKTQLKCIFRFLYEEGYTENRPFDGVRIGTAKYGTPVYITIDERNKIADTDLLPGWEALPKEERQHIKVNYETLAIQRDIFIFQCHIGCRVSDLEKLTESNIINGMLIYTPHKTKDSSEEQARVPLHPKALALIEKYKGIDKKGRLFPFITQQRYNDAIKVIFKLSGITRAVDVRNPLTGENEMVPINTIASSHMARRTFVGNLYLKVQDPNLIGKMSGHVDGSRAFKRYRKIEDDTLRNVIDLNG